MDITRWIDGGIKPLPERAGYYQVRNNPNREMWPRRGWMINAIDNNGVSKRYWNGKRWLAWKDGPPSVMGRTGLHQWRGLTKPASK